MSAHYDPLAAFDSFSREELLEAVRMWIKRTDAAESRAAELQAALQNFIPEQVIQCRACVGGTWEVECCSGANGCDCRGEPVPMGRCNVCGGTGSHGPDADLRANIRTIDGRCFIGRGPTTGYWAGK